MARVPMHRGRAARPAQRPRLSTATRRSRSGRSWLKPARRRVTPQRISGFRAGIPRRRLILRSPGYRRKPWYYRHRSGLGYPYPLDWDGYPAANDGSIEQVGVANFSGDLSQTAQQSLQRKGLTTGIWRRRLANADPELLRFINRFHRVAGFERLLGDFFGDPYQKAVVRMAIHTSYRLAKRDPEIVQNLHFDRRVGFAPDGVPILTIVAGHRGVHYRFFPWKQIYKVPLLAQLKRDALVYRDPRRIRWVFPRERISSARDIVDRLRQLAGKKRWQGVRRWLTHVEQMIVRV